MILGQLIQTGRRFCECRSHDFIPESDDKIVLIAYSSEDRFLAQSIDGDPKEIEAELHEFLEETDAVAYLMIRRHIKNIQDELPSPIGRDPMDRITITAATSEMQRSVVYFLQSGPGSSNFKLIACNRTPLETPNLFQPNKNYDLPISPLSGESNHEPELLVG